MRRSLLLSAALVVLSLGTLASAQTLSLPDNLVDLRTEQGEKYLKESDDVLAFGPLVANYVTQKTQTFCGVASIVMVVNALQLQAPAVPEYDPYHTFTQDNLLDAKTEAILPRAVLAERGMTLDQIGGLLTSLSLKAEVVHASDTTLDAFRDMARAHLSKPGQFIIANYLRKAMGQEKGGHISPLAAYDKLTDRFLILDVARYKYPPVWVTAADLFTAMKTTDSDNQNRTRGFVLISKGGAG